MKVGDRVKILSHPFPETTAALTSTNLVGKLATIVEKAYGGWLVKGIQADDKNTWFYKEENMKEIVT